MLTLSPGVAALIGAVLAIWLGLATWAVMTGLGLRKRAQFATNQADRLAALMDSAPALPLMIRNDGRIEAPPRLADWLGLARRPNFVSDLTAPDAGLRISARDLAKIMLPRSRAMCRRSRRPGAASRARCVRKARRGRCLSRARPPQRGSQARVR